MTKVERRGFGVLPDGRAATLFSVKSARLEAVFTDYGARLVALKTPDRDGRMAHVVLGYDSLGLYVADKTYSGAVVGRFGNRIAGGRFSLDGKTFRVPLNNGANALHGGPVGFDRKVWAAEIFDGGVGFTLVSADGDQGFPGALTVTARYTLEDEALRIEYTALTDAATIVNVTNHAYFNLAGDSSGTILDQYMMLSAEHYTPVDAGLIPTGDLVPVGKTPFDFRHPKRIGERIDAGDVQLERAGGYDHNWAMGSPGVMKLAARLSDPVSGRVMTVETTEPGIQFYSGNFMNGTMPNRLGGMYPRRGGVCLETQHYPDSPNQPNFPSTVLRPGEELRSVTVFGFGAQP